MQKKSQSLKNRRLVRTIQPKGITLEPLWRKGQNGHIYQYQKVAPIYHFIKKNLGGGEGLGLI